MNKHNQHNVGVDVAEMIAALEPGLKRTVLRVLSYHIGRGQALGRKALVAEVRRMVPCHDRQVRLVINELRKDEVLICSTGGIDGGYWLAQDDDEYQAYRASEVVARIVDMNEQLRAMDAAALRQFGPVPEGKQLNLMEV